MNLKNSLNLTTLILVVIVGSASFWGGMKYQQSRTPSFIGRYRDQAGGTGANSQIGIGPRRMGNGQIVGEITNVADTSITVKSNDGSSKIVLLSDKTNLNQASTAAKTDLKIGGKVAIFGTSNPDGSITGVSIQLITGQ